MKLGLLKPTMKVSRPFKKALEVFRCDTDGGLVPMHTCPSDGHSATPHRCPFAPHFGHKLKQPVILKLHELVMIWAGLIR